jgi:hypothetical protein
MAKRMTATLKAEMMQIVDAWKAAGGVWPAPVSAIVDFALKRQLYNVPARVRRMCANDLAEAMREEYITDSRGRPVRKLHAARFPGADEDGKKTQQTLWADIDTAPREFMEVAFQQRREQIVGDCKQLSNDVEYFNSKRPSEAPIQMWFDFRDDVNEGNQPEEYRDSPGD